MAKLLIVDDDIRLRKLVRTYGEVEHYECEEAADGLSALEKLQDADFDLVILDVMMPGLDGFETLERIRKTSEIPVIMLTDRLRPRRGRLRLKTVQPEGTDGAGRRRLKT